MQVAVALAEGRLEADRQRAAQAMQEASARANQQQAGLQRELEGCQAACAELKDKAASTAGDLEEARWGSTVGSFFSELHFRGGDDEINELK